MKSYKDCKVPLLTFSGGKDLGLLGINYAAQPIADNYGDEETILFTVVIDESMWTEMRESDTMFYIP
jgi:cell division GTPase FtsZ